MTRHSPEHPGALPAEHFAPGLAAAERLPADFLPNGHSLAESLPADEACDVAAGEEPAEARLAMAAYLSVPFFGFVVPLVVYMSAFRRFPWLRAHAAQALNVWVTVALYDLSIALMGAMLALDNLQVAVLVAVPALVALWLTALVFLVRAAVTASHGGEYAVPHWLCTRIAR